MKQIEAFIEKCVNEKGYMGSDFIISGKEIVNDGREKVLVKEVEKITFPVDTELISSAAKSAGASAVILIDSSLMFIYEIVNNEVMEVPELPTVTEDFTRDELNNARYFKNILKGIRDVSNDYELIQLGTLAACIYRDEKLKTRLFENVSSDDMAIVDEVMEITGLDMSALKKIEEPRLMEIVRMFQHVDFTPSVCLGQIFIRILGNNMMNPMLSGDAYDSMMQFMKPGCKVLCRSQYAFNATVGRKNIACVDVSLPFEGADYNNSTLNLHRMLKYISGTDCKVVGKLDDTAEFDSILAAPVLGGIGCKKIEGAEKLHIRHSEEVELYESLQMLPENGRLVAIVPSGFLFRNGNVALRNYIRDNYSILAIEKIKKPFSNTMIDGAIVVIENSPSSKVVFNASLDMNARLVSKNMNETILDPTKNNDLIMIEQSEMGDSWDVEDYIKKDSEEITGTPLTSVCKVIRGVIAKSSSYYPEGSPAGIPYLRISNITDGKINLDDCKRIPSTDAKILSQPGDIVLSVTGTIGKLAIVKDELFVPSSQTVILRPMDVSKSQEIFEALKTEKVQKQIEFGIRGSTIKNLSTTAIKSILL